MRFTFNIQAHIDVQWDDLESDEFLNDLANSSMSFTAEKLVPKGLKAVKGAKAAPVEEEEAFSAVSLVAPSAPKKTKTPKKKAPPSGDDAAEDEEVLEFGLADSTPIGKAKTHKRPRLGNTKAIDSSEIPEGKITMPSATSAGDALMLEDSE